MLNFLPPVVFQIEANAKDALTKFGQVNKELDEMRAKSAGASKSVNQMSKSAVGAAKSIDLMRIAQAAFVGLVIKEVLQAEQAYVELGQALANVGLNTEQARTRVEGLLDSFVDIGIGSDEAAAGMTRLIQATGDLALSERLLAMSANLAVAQHTNMTNAARQLVLAQSGNLRVFKQFGIEIDKSKSKTEGIAEAMNKLEAILANRASAAANTFAGQMRILRERLMDFADGIGAIVLPILNKFMNRLNATIKFLQENQQALFVFAGVITTVVVAAVVQLTKRLYQLAAAWLAANWPIVAVTAAVVGAAAAFVYFWNKSKGVRETVVNLGKLFIEFAEGVVKAFRLVLNMILLVVRGTANAQIALGKLLRNDEMVRRGKATLDWIDQTNKTIDDFSNTLNKAQSNLDKFKDTKIDLSKFKLPKFEIPEFANGDPLSDGITEEIVKGLANAKQAIKDFNREIAAEFEVAVATWGDIIARDFNKEIEDKLAANLDDLVYKAQAAVDAYASASAQYSAAMEKLTRKQEAYTRAVKAGDEAAVAAAKSAMDAAEDAAAGIVGTMNDMLSDISKLQDDMISKIVDTRREIQKLEIERTKILEEAQKDRLELERDYNAEVAKIRKQYDLDVQRAQQDAARRSAEIVRQSVDQMRNVFKSATYRSIADIYSGITYEGRYMKGGSVERILKNLGLQAGKAEQLASNAAALAGMGFSQTFIEEVISLGPDLGNSLAKTILTATPESIAQLKTYWEQLQKVSSHGVDTIAESLNKGTTLATEELTRQLADVKRELDATLVELDNQLKDSLAQAFNDYANALDEVNTRVAAQIAAIDAQIDALLTLIATLQAALTALQGLGAPGTANAGVDVVGAATAATTNAAAVAAEAAAAAAAADAAALEAEAAAALAEIEAAALLAEAMAALKSDTSVAGTVFKNNQGMTLNIYAETNASADDIAKAAGWMIRTQGDAQYRTAPSRSGGGNMEMM